jgi:hypothetical protein
MIAITIGKSYYLARRGVAQLAVEHGLGHANHKKVVVL